MPQPMRSTSCDILADLELPFTDIDKVLIVHMPIISLAGILGEFVDLAKNVIPDPPDIMSTVLVVSAPIKVYVAQGQQVQLAEKLVACTSHSFLPTSSQSRRFLATATPRRVHSSDLLKALMAADSKTVTVEQYGFKSADRNFNFLSQLPSTALAVLDFGCLMNPDNMYDTLKNCVLLSGVHDDRFMQGQWRIHCMFQDNLKSHSAPIAGTVQYTGRIISPVGNVKNINVYLSFVHYWKAMTPENSKPLPKSGFQLRSRLSMLAG
jgi:hypothetical protein